MTTIQAQLVGDTALVPKIDLERLVALAGRNETVELQWSEDDLPTIGVMRLAERGQSFDFWQDAGEDIYTLADGEPVA